MACKCCEDHTAGMGDRHESCYSELLRRLADRYCTRCGTPIPPSDNVRCAGCAGMDDPPFTGYPGGD